MKVSVVVPVYNGSRTAQRMAGAVLGLDPPPGSAERPSVVLVDDGSTDDSAEILRRCGARVISQPNGGPAAARNTGWRAADGDVILFTDADCFPPANWAACLAPAFVDPTVGAAGGSYDIANPGSALARLIHAEIMLRHSRMPNRVKALGSYNLAVRRDVLERLGGFDESYATASGEDNDLSYRIREAGWELAFRPNCRVAHRHPEKLRPYLRTQFVHGWWRSRLYRRHAKYCQGDDYSGFGDFLDALLAALAMAAAALAPLRPSWFGPAAASCLLALLAVSAFSSWRLARRSGEARLLPLGTAVFSLRAGARILGFAAGLLRLPLPGKAFRRR